MGRSACGPSGAVPRTALPEIRPNVRACLSDMCLEDCSALALSRRAEGAMASVLSLVHRLSRTVWTQAFSDPDSRDDFYLWLVERVDRWDAWCDMAYNRGGSTLTQRLLAMVVAEGGGDRTRATRS